MPEAKEKARLIAGLIQKLCRQLGQKKKNYCMTLTDSQIQNLIKAMSSKKYPLKCEKR